MQRINQTGHFATTCWTNVLAAQGAGTRAGPALADLCAAYYVPVHTWIARTSRDLGDPQDLTQEFFSRVLGGALVLLADQDRGRFRAYLLGAVKHFLADARDRQNAAKRGYGHEHVRLPAGTETSPGWEIPAPESEFSDAGFDREWGMAVLAVALESLAAEHTGEEKVRQFEVLKPWLTGDGAGTSQAAAAALSMSEGAVKVAIHRLRKRFRDLVKAGIAQTVTSDEDARDELRYLIEVVSQAK